MYKIRKNNKHIRRIFVFPARTNNPAGLYLKKILPFVTVYFIIWLRWLNLTEPGKSLGGTEGKSNVNRINVKWDKIYVWDYEVKP